MRTSAGVVVWLGLNVMGIPAVACTVGIARLAGWLVLRESGRGVLDRFRRAPRVPEAARSPGSYSGLDSVKQVSGGRAPHDEDRPDGGRRHDWACTWSMGLITVIVWGGAATVPAVGHAVRRSSGMGTGSRILTTDRHRLHLAAQPDAYGRSRGCSAADSHIGELATVHPYGSGRGDALPASSGFRPAARRRSASELWRTVRRRTLPLAMAVGLVGLLAGIPTAMESGLPTVESYGSASDPRGRKVPGSRTRPTPAGGILPVERGA